MALASVACSSSSSGTVQLVTGGEDAGTTFAGVTTLQVDWVDSTTGQKNNLVQSAPYPATTIDLGDVSLTALGQIEVTGLDANQNTILFGSTIPYQFSSLDSIVTPLFVQRTGALARLPGALSASRSFPLLGVLGSEYLFVAGGLSPYGQDPGATELYDLGGLSTLPQPPPSPLPDAESMAIVNTMAFFVDTQSVVSLDLSSNTAAAVTLPSGATPADIAGGATIQGGSDGAQFIVGATRTAHEATDAVLRMDTDGGISWLTLAAPRWGAAATWVDNEGLVVAGGSESAPGVEVVGPLATTGIPTAWPADATTGGAATALGGSTVLLAGGILPSGSDPGVRAVDVSCAAGCKPVPWAPLPMPLSWASAAASTSLAAVVVGSDLPSGASHVFAVTSTSATEVPQKAALSAVRVVPSPLGPVGSLLLVGGSVEVESFLPQP